ncbi:hypothetical protein BGW80DRAFT_1259925 [Lactifluus volemus]|nr:hypothetical protein BGW80DRAFT_1259925 [Lactifluus volemus]
MDGPSLSIMSMRMKVAVDMPLLSGTLGSFQSGRIWLTTHPTPGLTPGWGPSGVGVHNISRCSLSASSRAISKLWVMRASTASLEDEMGSSEVGERSGVFPGRVVTWYDGDGGGGGKSEWYDGARLAGIGAMVLPRCHRTNSVISVRGRSMSGGGEGTLVDLTLYRGSDRLNRCRAS